MNYNLALLRATLNSSIDGVLVVSHETREVKEYNQRFLKLWKIPPALVDERNDEKLISFVTSQLTHPEKFIHLVQHLYSNPWENSQDVLEFKDGRIFERQSEPLIIEGEIAGRVWYFRDNTERIKNDNLLKNILGVLPSLVSYVDRDMKYQYVNTAYERWFDVKKEDIVGKTLTEILGLKAYQIINHYVDRVFAGENVDFEAQVPYERGPTKSVHVQYIPDFNEENEVRGYYSIVRDVTQEKKDAEDFSNQQALLIGASKLSALGEMAGSIAHEINNPLSIIKMSTLGMKKLISKKEIDVAKVNEFLEDIESTIERAAKIITGLRNISRNSKDDDLVVTSFSEILNDVLSVAAEKFKSHGIELRQIVSSKDLNQSFVINRIQITQVLINLLNNSYDAISALSEKWIGIEISIKDSWMTLKVTDSGKGIPSEVREKMFNPFYTTKEIGKGTGIGLSISKSIIEKHNGQFFYDDSLGHTSFVILLPFVQSKTLSIA